MNLTYDREIQIAIGRSRKSANWSTVTMTVSGLWEKLHMVTVGNETLAEYMQMKKSAQDELKDVGGFVGGKLIGPRRKAEAVVAHDLVTLDFDNIPGWKTDDVISQVEEMGVAYCVYSTRKHCPNKPRLRVVVPLDRSVTSDEYEPIARRIAEIIGIQMADQTTFDNNRLMYWPSACRDSEIIYRVGDYPFVCADKMLSTYADWHDVLSWPQVPGSFNYKRLAVRQGEPTEKPGIVGLFCRVYDINRALDEILPGIYTEVEGDDNRLTYTGGSTTGGAVIYDGGKFLYSHHATDPCSGRLLNAFDLVRLHKFADQDVNADSDTPVNRLPSFAAMIEYAGSLEAVIARRDQEMMDQIQADFADVAKQTASAMATPDGGDDQSVPPDISWMMKLKRGGKNEILPTIDNIILILQNDPNLAGKFAYNAFAGRGQVFGQPLPWSPPQGEKRRLWADSDISGSYWYLEKYYQINKRQSIDSALEMHANKHAFNDVQDYLLGLTWDGVKRLDTLFIDYLGAQDTEYTRIVTRKMFTAAVARAMDPGCKFDNMLILCGPQGVGKSTVLDKMSRGFFNDSIRTFEGKEASELLQGVWLVEIAELDAFRQSDVSRIKQFLSLRSDRYRAAYAKNVKQALRCCVFFGTCNNYDVLRDNTGNRRFWPVDVYVKRPTMNVFKDLDQNIDQLWAEAKTRWQMGEPLHLSESAEILAKAAQEGHMEINMQDGVIEEFVNREVPSDWVSWPLDKRRIFWGGGAAPETYTLAKRENICAAEVWCELFNKPLPADRRASQDINTVLRSMKNLIQTSSPSRKYGKTYGNQRGFTVLPDGQKQPE